MPLPNEASANGGSLFEKLAITVAAGVGFPQSSNTWASRFTGQPTGDEKLLPSCRIAMTSLPGVHAALLAPRNAVAAVELPVTTKLALMSCDGEPSEGTTVTVPVYTPALSDDVLALTINDADGDSEMEADVAL